MNYIKLLKVMMVFLPVTFAFCSKDSENKIDIEESETVSDFDGNIYKTVKIGNQVWMAENLKTIHFSDGTWAASYIYDNKDTNLVYGRLYHWQTVVNNTAGTSANPSNIQGIAPTGWHIPSKAEWQELINYLGGTEVAGGKLKETSEVHWQSPNTDATNESLFSALPGGMFAFWMEYQWINQYSVFATATDASLPGHPAVYAIKLDYNTSKVTIGDFHPDDAVSVRCVKD